jgi:Zn-dependent peptidase ImmA (M78 family)
MEQDIISYQSIFLDDVKITVIFKENENYDMLHILFEKYGFGFYHPKTKTIIIDGELFVDSELDMDDLRFVEAHEIGHLMLGHSGGERYDEDEIDADLAAYLLLVRKGLSTKRLTDTFEERHGIKFTIDLIDKFKDRL